MFEALHSKKRSFFELSEILVIVALFVGTFIGILACFTPSDSALARARAAQASQAAAAEEPKIDQEISVTFVPCLPGHAQTEGTKPVTALDSGAASTTVAPCDRNR